MIQWALTKTAVFKKMFIAYNFLSRRDTEKLNTPSYFSRQNASKYVSGDPEVIFKIWRQVIIFDPDKFCDPTENTSNQNFKVFSHSLRHLE